MKLPMWTLRWLHRSRLSRSRLKGTFLHSWLGDRILNKDLWRPTPESLARAWLVGFPITMMPFLPAQSLLAVVAALLLRGNLLLAIALQYLSNPFTAPVHLPACYFVGELLRGHSPVAVWQHLQSTPMDLLTGGSVASLYSGAFALGILGGSLGYALIRSIWKHPGGSRPKSRPRHAASPRQDP
jgi:uncharacterized protein (DUF2062 family)